MQEALEPGEVTISLQAIDYTVRRPGAYVDIRYPDGRIVPVVLRLDEEVLIKTSREEQN